MIDLILKEVKDEYIRENLVRLANEIDRQILLKMSFKHLEITVLAAVTNFRYKHGLGFQPKDLIQTFNARPSTTVTWNYDLFDKDFVDVTTNGATTIRVLVGTYRRIE